jgi:alkanesulfonate monooxygenase SsuD/methylene tetrahydromethanopterin reductase-like flavin-dependent oxidoreductase (luciferase family)
MEGITYEEVLQDRVVYGTPEVVASRLGELRDILGLSGVIMEPKVGGMIPQEHLQTSIRLFGQEVGPRLE